MNAHGNPNRRPSTVSAAQASALPLALLLAGCGPSGERALIEGDRLLQLGKVAEAVPLLERAAQDLPQNAPALNHLGLAYHAIGKTNEARRAYLRALEIDRNRIEATYNLAITHLERGELLEAEKGFRAYLIAHPGDAAVLGALAQLQYQAGRWDDAERSLAAIQPPQAVGADGWNTRGVLCLRKRRFKDAAACFQYALSLDPSAAAPRFNLGVTHQLQGDRRTAAAQYRQWLATAPASAQASVVQELIRQWETPPPPTAPVAPLAPMGTNAPAPLVQPKPIRPAVPGSRTNVVAEANRPAPASPAAALTVAAAGSATAPASRVPEATAPATAPAPVAAPVPPPQIAPPPPLQVVNVQEDPPLRPAQDDPPAKPVSPAITTPPAATSPQAKPVTAETPVASVNPGSASAPASPGTGQPSDASEAGPSAKRSLLQRMTPGKWANPVQWFRKSSDTNAPAAPAAISPAKPAEVAAKSAPKPASMPAKKPTPLSPPASGVPATAPATSATTTPPRPAPRAEIASPRRPAPPRYVRRAVGLLPAGNRSAAESVFQQATAAHQRRDLATASAQYRRATEVDPSFHEAYHNLALVAMDQGDLSLALLACEQALLIRPSDAETRRNFAVALKQAGHPQDAAEQLELFLASKPADAASHLAAAGLYAGELDEPSKARPHYEAVLALEPSHPQAAAIRGWLASHPR